MKPKNQEIEEQDALLLKQKRYRSFYRLLLMVLNICLSSFYFGYTITYLGTFTFTNISEIFHIDMSKQTAQGLFNGCIPVGAGIGALTSFILLQKFSRKQALLLVNAIALVFGATLFIQNQYIFLFSRIMQGVCVGFYSAIAPLIIKQFAPNQISGTLGACNQLFVAFGVFFACIFQLILKLAFGKDDDTKQKDYWYIMFGFTLITLLTQTLLLLFVYKFQTPKYLLEKGQQKQARQVLQWIYLDQYVQQVLNEKKVDLGLNTSSENKQSVVSIQSNQLTKKQPTFSKLRFIVSIHLAMLQQFVGINAVVIYGTEIAQNVLPDYKNIIPVILNLQQTLTCLFTTYLLTKLGRKTILQFGTLVGIISLVMIGIGFIVQGSGANTNTFASVLIISGLIIFMADFGLSLGPVVWLYIPEILEPNYIAFSTLANWTTASLITILFPILKQSFGSPSYLFLFYAAYSTAGLVFSQKFVIQTKGKTQKDIYNEYQRLTA